MASDYHISYELINSYPAEDIKWESTEAWFESVKQRIEKISIRKENSDDLNSTFPGWRGSSLSLLKRGIKNRMVHKGKSIFDSQGWRVFDGIQGEYRVVVDDRKLIEEKGATLSRMLDIFNVIPELTQQDPNPPPKSKIKEEVDLETGEIIERGIIYASVTQNGRLSFGGVMGYISQNHPSLKSQMKELAPEIRNRVEAVIEEIETNGMDEIESRYKKIFKEKGEDVKIGKAKNIEYFFAIGDYEPEDVYYEGGVEEEGSIKIRNLIRKVKNKQLRDELNTIKPGASEWPESASGIYTIVITNEPVSVATKSTGRPWATSSCEDMNACHYEGPFSDIEWGNCIAYVFNGDKLPEGFPETYDATLQGRTLLRWGLNREGVVKVGLERRLYPSRPRFGSQMAQAIIMILNDNNVLAKKITTPYAYRGWGDTQGGSNRKLTYSMEGFRFEGQEIDIESNVLGLELARASSPVISYSDVLRLSRTRNDIRVRRQLAQNPSIFLNLEAVSRLLRVKDLSITKFIAESKMAEGELLLSIAKEAGSKDIVTGAYYFDYLDPSITSLVSILIKNPNTPLEAHQLLREQHPGYGRLSFDAVQYAGAFGNMIIEPFMCPAPAEIMGDVIDGLDFVLKGDVKANWFDNRGRMVTEDMTPIGGGAKNPSQIKWAFYAKMVSHLLYAPNMNLYNYKKLIRKFKSFLSRRPTIQKIMNENLMIHDAIKETIKNIGMSYCIPLTTVKDWGFQLNPYEGMTISTGYTIERWKEIATQFDRQNPDILRDVLELCNDELLIDYEGSKRGMLFENLRNLECALELWDNRVEYEIPPFAFFYLARDTQSPLEPTTRSVISDTIIAEAYNLESDEVKSKLKIDFPPTHRIRKGVPRNVINQILESPKICRTIGVDVVALWLIDPQRHFELFESILLKIALRDLWEGGEFKDIPQDLLELFEQTEEFGILEMAAIGDGETTGLVRNPRLPEFLQKSLLEDWVEISNTYEGGYGQNMISIEEPLATNPNTVESLLEYFVKKEGLQLKVAQNPNTGQKILAGPKARGQTTSLYYQYPVEVLTNPGLSQYAFDNLWNITIDFLRTEVEVDAERLFNVFEEGGNLKGNLVSYRKGSEFRSAIRNLLDSYQWLEYWRGGSVKSGSFSNFSRRNMWLYDNMEGGGIADSPIPIIGRKSIIILYDSKSPPEGNPNKIYFLDETIPKKEGKVLVKGKSYHWEEDSRTYIFEPIDGTYEIEEFYRFIKPDERGGSVPTYTIAFPNGKQRTYDNMEIVVEKIERWNQNHEEQIDEDTVIVGEKDAPKWEVENIFVFTDKDPPSLTKKVPAWRYTWRSEQLMKILETYVQRKDCASIFLEWKNEPFVVEVKNVGAGQMARLDATSLIVAIDGQNAWTEELVNYAIPILFERNAQIFNNCSNVPLTEKLLQRSLNYDTDSLQKDNLTVEDIERAQCKILSYSEVPAFYIYEIYQISTNDNILEMANLARLGNPISYNKYYAQITQAAD